MSGRVTLVRPGSITSVSVMWWEWRDLTALATLYGWRGVPDAERMSTAEASDFAHALERARIPSRLGEVSDRVRTLAKGGGIDLVRER